jgi:hypothetical protein
VICFRRNDCFCADLDYTTLENIHVKNEINSSGEFAICVRTAGKTYVRRLNTGITGIQGSYWNTCTPSAFPVEPEPDAPPPGSGCGKPYPPPITRFGAKVHVKNPTDDMDSIMLDSTPLVGPNPEYCATIGYTDGRFFCPVRMEGDPQRRPCENWIVGVAPDTGRPGTTWSRNAKWGSAEWEKHSGVFCTTREETACRHNENNPYSLYVYPGGQGEYYACNAEGSICSGAVLVEF